VKCNTSSVTENATPAIKLLSFSFALALVGCSASGDRDVAEAAVARFHADLDASRFDPMYVAASDDLKGSATHDEFVGMLAAIHRRLGLVKSAEPTSWAVKFQASGATATLAYKTAYANGEATEAFLYRMKDGQALLMGYDIHSDVLEK
jgi:hypothetical protein